MWLIAFDAVSVIITMISVTTVHSKVCRFYRNALPAKITGKKLSAFND